jgi:transposase InsO family protein
MSILDIDRRDDDRQFCSDEMDTKRCTSLLLSIGCAAASDPTTAARPSTSTIRRILYHHGLMTAQPRKRPQSAYIRFQAAQPNECWQSDFTHWKLADGSDIEILSWLDDHSRYLLTAAAYRRVGGPDVVASFLHAATTHRLPASTQTDNGSVCTSRFTHGHNAFKPSSTHWASPRRTGTPDVRETRGEIERFHQTVKRLLTLGAQRLLGGTNDLSRPPTRLVPRPQRGR